jgi:26S proteasome regulatory subunit N7
MAPYYRYITSTSDPSTSMSLPTNTTASLPFDSRLYEEMASQNKEELDKLDARLAEAEKTEGESEIGDALRAKATYLTKIGDKVWRHRIRLSHRLLSHVLCACIKENALSALALALDKTPGLGSKIDLVLTLVRVGFFFSSEQIIKDNLAKADE